MSVHLFSSFLLCSNCIYVKSSHCILYVSYPLYTSHFWYLGLILIFFFSISFTLLILFLSLSNLLLKLSIEFLISDLCFLVTEFPFIFLSFYYSSFYSFQFPVKIVMLGFYFLAYNKHSWSVSANSITQGPVGLCLLSYFLLVSLS